MDKELFADLLAGLEEAVEVINGRAVAARESHFDGRVLVEIREDGKTVWTLAEAARQLAEKLPMHSLPLVQPEVRFIREQLNQTQAGFADLLGVSVETVRKWEQKKREPRGPARKLLTIAVQNPAALLAASA